MPAVRITLNVALGERRRDLCDGFHAMMVDVLRIREHDRLIVIDEKPDGLFQPLDTEGGYALVEITLFEGRSVETKRRLYRRIAELFERYGVVRANTRIILYEVGTADWGIRGGQAACDVSLGFNTDV